MKKKTYFINIILVIFIFIIVLLINKVSPFGNNIFAYSDGTYQFKPMLFDMVMKIKHNLLESYSFSNGLGNPTIFNCLYYLSSPINIIALLFNNADIMYLAVILVKLAIASFSMTFYVSKKTDKSEVIIIATLSYVFCTWLLTYYYYLTWLDVFMIFPLYQYGLEEIINKKISCIYIFSLSYMIMTSFYLSFSVCIYTIIFFIIYGLFYKKDKISFKIKSFYRISIGTIISLLLSSFTIFLLYKFSLKSGVKLEHFSSLYYTDIKGILKSLLYLQSSFVTNEDTPYSFPNIACNILILYNIIYYFLNRHISKRDKIYSFVVILIILFAFFNPYFDFVLNFFHQIRGLTYRYSFIISFLMIMLYVKNNQYDKDDERDKIRKLISFLILTLFVAFSLKRLMNNDLYMGSGFVNMVFVACYCILTFIKGNNRYDKLLIIFVVCIESFVAINEMSIIPFPKEHVLNRTYRIDNTTFRYGSRDIPPTLEDKESNSNFNLYTNQKSTILMSSMTYSNVIYMIRDFGNYTYFNTCMEIVYDNYISRMIFNEKNDKYNLEKIFSSNKDIKKVKLKKKKRKINEENTIKAMSGINIFDSHKYKPVIKGNFCKLDIDSLDGISDGYFYDEDLLTGEFIVNKKKCNNRITLYTYNEDKIKEAYQYLAKNQIKYTYYSDSKLEGIINVDKDQLIFTSIPYDKDWNIYIDGKKVKPIKLLNSLIGIETSPGKHKIKMEYKEHLFTPSLVSIFTFIGIMIKFIIDRIKDNKE